MTLEKNNIQLENNKFIEDDLDLSKSKDNLISPFTASGSYPWQTTIFKPKSFDGIGLHTGNIIKVNLKPNKENTGIIFIRTDIDGNLEKRSIKGLYKNVSEKYSVCSNKCKSLIKKFDYINKVDDIVIGMNNYKWNTVEDLSKKVEISKFDFVSSVRRLIYFENELKAKEDKEINQNSLISRVKK